jgi:hypothetical protein
MLGDAEMELAASTVCTVSNGLEDCGILQARHSQRITETLLYASRAPP